MSAHDEARKPVEYFAAERARLLAQLETVESSLHMRMREMREVGATQLEVLTASGYRSMDAVRKILDPEVKAGAARARARKRENVA